MRNSITNHFWLRHSTIYLRLTVNGVRTEISTDQKINSSLWDSKYEKVKGKSDIAKRINSRLNELLNDVSKYLSYKDKVTAWTLQAI